MKLSELEDWDPVRYLKSEESLRHYLAAAFAEHDPAAIQNALGVVARARGMTAIARESGVSREALYRALSQSGNAEFATILKVVGSLGLRLTIAGAEEAPIGEAEPEKSKKKVAAKKPAARRTPAKKLEKVG